MNTREIEYIANMFINAKTKKERQLIYRWLFRIVKQRNSHEKNADIRWSRLRLCAYFLESV